MRSRLAAIQEHFHELIRARAKEFQAPTPPALPGILLLKPGGKALWFQVPGMYGGFKYRLKICGGEPVLLTSSWCRVVGGSEEDHEIRPDGIKLVHRHDPSEDYIFHGAPKPKAAPPAEPPPPVLDYIRERIHQTAPPGAPVVAGSTPVVSFGDVREARVATLGWNPSKREFLDMHGVLLKAAEQRLETWESAKAKSSEAVGDVAAHVFHGCIQYFKRHPYRWFDRLRNVLKPLGASYDDGSACHLDFVQWATDPVWGKLSRDQRNQLLAFDVPFLQKQLRNESIQLLLLNGAGIVRAAQRHLGFQVQRLPAGHGSRGVMYDGRSDGLRVLGWNLNLQSAFGVSNEEMSQIADELGVMLGRKN